MLSKLPTNTRKAAPSRPQPAAASSSSASIIGGRTGTGYNGATQSNTGYGAYGNPPSYGGASFGGSQAGSSRPAASHQPQGPSPAQLEKIRKQQEALAKAAELQQMLNTLEKVNDEGRRETLLDSICTKDDVLNLPLHSDPPGTAKGNLKVDLLKHQLQALQWCIEKENPVLPTKESDAPVQFWQFKKNQVTGRVRDFPPPSEANVNRGHSLSTLTVSHFWETCCMRLILLLSGHEEPTRSCTRFRERRPHWRRDGAVPLTDPRIGSDRARRVWERR